MPNVIMNEYSRPASLDDLKRMLSALNEAGAEYLLVGGYALAAHGYQRATTDIDIVVPANPEAGMRIKNALMVLPDQAARDIDPAWFSEGENIRVADAFVVDLLLNANGQTYDTLEHYVEIIELDGIPVRTISLEGLLLTKQTLRDKDASDRIIIERALEIIRKS
jgi:predicted nucleotidyltransferase